MPQGGGFGPHARAAVPVAVAVLGGAAAIGFGGGALLGISVGGTASASRGESNVATAVSGASVTATCEKDPGEEADGSTVTYGPEHVLDDDPATAWRCEGDGKGERLTIELGSPALITEVALIPGYAKTDPVDDTDRYRENRRLSKVRWHFDGDVVIEQQLDTSPQNRALQDIAVPDVTSSTVVLELLDSVEAPRNRVAVSSIVLTGSRPQ